MKSNHLHVEEWFPVQGSMLPACIHSEGSSSAQLCHAVFSVYMVSIHADENVEVFPALASLLRFPPSPPPCVFCTQAVGRRGQSPWDTAAQTHVVPSHCAEEEGSKGTHVDSKWQGGDTAPH